MTSDLDARIAAALSDGANGSQPAEGAKDQPPGDNQPGNGTPGDAATVHQDDNGGNQAPSQDGNGEGAQGKDASPPEELIYSESSYQAARETALQEGREAALLEREETESKLRKQLLDAVKSSDNEPSKVLRSVSEAIKGLAPGLTDSDIDPPMKVIRDAISVINEAAYAIVGENYADAISDVLGNDKDAVNAFWKDAAALDPTLDFVSIVSLLAEHKALSSKAIRNAKPEDLIAANSKLKEHIQNHGDKRFGEGRALGRKDPPPEPTSEGRSSSSQAQGRLRDENGRIDIAAELSRIDSGG